MATRKQKRITKVWAACPGEPRQYKVAIQPLGEWCVAIQPESERYSVTHLHTGMVGFVTYSLRDAEKVLGAWARCEHFTLATWSKRLAKQLQRARDKALST